MILSSRASAKKVIHSICFSHCPWCKHSNTRNKACFDWASSSSLLHFNKAYIVWLFQVPAASHGSVEPLQLFCCMMLVVKSINDRLSLSASCNKKSESGSISIYTRCNLQSSAIQIARKDGRFWKYLFTNLQLLKNWNWTSYKVGPRNKTRLRMHSQPNWQHFKNYCCFNKIII